MAKRRARLNDENDPLSSTDKVLAGFEQLSQSASQPDDKSTSQQVSKPTSQPDDLLTSQQVSKLTSQPDDLLTSQQVSKLTSQPDDLLTSQQVSKSAIRKATFQLTGLKRKSSAKKSIMLEKPPFHVEV